jgi:hypothetical protein
MLSYKMNKNLEIRNVNNLSRSMKIEIKKKEYSLDQNLFDPSKSSPPNNFISKLQTRMKVYDFYQAVSDNNVDNFVNE